MPPFTTVIVAEAAVYAFVCLYYVMLYVRRRQHREYLAFGLFCGAMAVSAAGAAMLAAAPPLEEGGLQAYRLKTVGLLAATGFMVDLAHRLTGQRQSWGLIGTYLWAGVGVTATAAGVLFDPATLAPEPTWGLAAAPDYAEPMLTPIGEVIVVFGWLFVAHAIWLLVRSHDRLVRLITWACAANVIAAAHDVGILFLSLRSWYLIEHATLLSVMAMSALLLDRFATSSDALVDRTDELTRSYGELQRSQRELVQKEQLVAVGELSAVIAHEVRNPLAVIKNAAAGLRRDRASTEDRVTLLGILDEEVDRLGRLVDDLLAYARPVAPKERSVEVRELVEGATQTIDEDGEPRVEVELSFGGPDALHGDPDLLAQALANVVENSLHAMREGGTLRVTTRDAELEGAPAIAIEVRDTGEGMDAETMKKAREPFFTTRPSGTGLGLAIVDRLVGTHRGRVEVDSEVGSGTTVTLVLPAED